MSPRQDLFWSEPEAQLLAHCPDLYSAELPWLALRASTMQVLQCALSDSCSLKLAPYRYLLPMADDIIYRDHQEFNEVKKRCPMGFALAFALVIFFGQMEMGGDPVQLYGSAKAAASLLDLRSGKEEDLTFGGARPLPWLRLLGFGARQRLVKILNLPAQGGEPRRSRFWISSDGLPGNQSMPHAQAEESRRAFFAEAPRLCVEITHSHADDLQLLRNAVESLATAGLLEGTSLVLRVGCDGAWAIGTDSPEAWYLAWLRRRFGASVLCAEKETEPGCGESGLALVLRSTWHLLPFRPETVWMHLREAAELLRGGVAAVSLMEKTLQGFAGATGTAGAALHRQGVAPLAQDWRSLLLAAPALAENASAAEDMLSSIYELFALHSDSPSGTRWSMAEMPQGVQRCAQAKHHMCAPKAWWLQEQRSAWRNGGDVWLLGPETGGEAVALGSGLFQLAGRSWSYDHSPSQAEALGVPPCYACHHAREAEGEPGFTLYITVLDVLGSCRELFSNLLLDALEALQLASFQGPEVVLVEPFISNAVWQRFGQDQAEKLRASEAAEGRNVSIYAYWNQKTACGMRHGSVTPFGDLFDWPALTDWLRKARGIRGQISWEDFLRQTGGEVDVLAMQSEHRDASGAVQAPCEDQSEPATMRFYQSDLQVKRRVCVRSTEHSTGFELRFLDGKRLAHAVAGAVGQAKAQGKACASVGLYLYWVEGAERARLHPGRYGLLSSHARYTSIWSGLRFAPGILQRAAQVAGRLGLRHPRSGARRGFMAAHWRKGDWFLGPHPRKLEQARLAEAAPFAQRLRKSLAREKLTRLFLMTNAPPEAVQELAQELEGVTLLQAPFLKGDDNNLRQLCVEMAIASAADFFLAFGDGLIDGHVSMPSLLVMQMRLHAESWPLQSNAFSFAPTEFFADDQLGL